MDTSDLITSGFWSAADPVVLAPPRLGDSAARLQAELTGLPWAAGAVVFASSGSSGRPKWILLTRDALRTSATMVNAHLGVSSDDVWLLALPLSHVGGFGVAARADQAGGQLIELKAEWNPSRFVEVLEAEQVTCTALVPTQVHDLIRAGLWAPPRLRAVVVGGGGLAVETGKTARALGWPVLQSYGMTETASQVATASLESLEQPYSVEDLPVLPGWEVRTDETGRLLVRGEALFSGYVERREGTLQLTDPGTDGWFCTSDRVRLTDRLLTFEGRTDRTVKILGELVDLGALEGALQRLVQDRGEVALVAIEDARAGARIVPVVAGTELDWNRLVADFNQSQPGFARLGPPVVVSELPRTGLGKPDLQALHATAVEKSG